MNVFLGYPPEHIKQWIIDHSSTGPDLSIPLCFTAVDAGATIALKCNGNNLKTTTFQTSTDGSTWTDYTYATNVTLANAGDKVYFKAKADNTSIARTSTNYLQFTTTQTTKKVNVSGNIMSLLSPEFSQMISVGSYCFCKLFYQCKNIADCNGLTLPATTLAEDCYGSMFDGCTNLTQAPVLPATTLARYCYSYMFSDCTNLTQAPALPATTLAKNCYSNMFQGCASLTSAPAIKTYTSDLNAFNYMLNVFDQRQYTQGRLTSCNWTDLTLDEAEEMLDYEEIFGYGDESGTVRISITCKDGTATVYFDLDNEWWVFER